MNIHELRLLQYPPLVLDIDIHTLSRDQLRWMNRNCSTDVIDELVIKIMEHNEKLKDETIKLEKIQQTQQTSWLPSPSLSAAPRPRIMKKAPRIFKLPQLPHFSQRTERTHQMQSTQ